MEEKKQKKIKASAEAGEASRVPGQTSLAAVAAPLPRPGKLAGYQQTSLLKHMTEPEFVEGNAADALLYKVSYGFSSLSDIPNPNISDIAEG